MAKVLMPSYLEQQISYLVERNEEANGLILARPRDDDLVLQYMVLTNFREGVHLHADKKRAKVAQALLKRMSGCGYRTMHFHTHSNGTVGRAPQLATHFSRGDVEFYKQQSRKDPAFTALLVTPQKKLLYGLGGHVLAPGDSIFGAGEVRPILSALEIVLADRGLPFGTFVSLGMP
ncbi:hypothetical protein HYU16_01450 [Candidatus Woesearchaeota archaeon]|nr:hypothetical protein [Candidatus Woesearchaeota archaeon]